MLFSYYMGNLNHMILQFNMIDEDDNYESDLVKFLHTLENYNMGYPLNKKFQKELTEYIHFIQENNRNKFQLLESDQLLFNQLPPSS